MRIFNHFDVNTRQYQQPQIVDYDFFPANSDPRALLVTCYDLIPARPAPDVFGRIGQNDIMHVQVMWAGEPRPGFEVRSAVRDMDLVRGVPVQDIVDDYERNFPNLIRRELQFLVNIYKFE